MSDVTPTRTTLGPAFALTVVASVVLLVGGVIGNVLNQRAVRADVSTSQLHMLPIHAFTGFSFTSSVLPRLLPNQIVQWVCQGAMVIGLVVLVAVIAHQLGIRRGKRISA